MSVIMNSNDKWGEDFICPNGCTYMLNAKDERIKELEDQLELAVGYIQGISYEEYLGYLTSKGEGNE